MSHKGNVAVAAGYGIRCPQCGSADQEVTDSRPATRTIRRVRKCRGCGHKFGTYECVAVARMGARAVGPTVDMLDVFAAPEAVVAAARKLRDLADQLDGRKDRAPDTFEDPRPGRRPKKNGHALAEQEVSA